MVTKKPNVGTFQMNFLALNKQMHIWQILFVDFGIMEVQWGQKKCSHFKLVAKFVVEV